MRKIRLFFLAIITLNILCTTPLLAQERFDLSKRGGHYYFTATLGDKPVEIMVESGIPALLVGENIYESCLKSHDLTFQPSKQKIRLLNNLYNIIYRTEGEIMIGGALYDGPIFILEDFNGVSIPIQYMKDSATKRKVMTVDLKEGYLLVGQTDENLNGRRFKLSFDEELGFPIVAASVKLTTPQGRSKLKGNLIVDFGNPMLLFLLKQHESITKVIEKGKIELKNAYNKKGELVAQGIYANSVSLFGQEYNDKSIGVTDKMPAIKQLGFLGVQFFTSPVVFDFDKGVMIMR
ncbi:MAG: hypothetical protein IIV58_04035 [Alistipes sp.]|nr:hypothetical protein [Alistipes sp.]